MKELETPKGIHIGHMFMNALSELSDDGNVFFKHNDIVVVLIKERY